MAWFRPEKPWKAKSEVSNVRETQVGPNSYRINVVRKGKDADNTVSEAKEAYLSAKALRKLNAKHFRSNFDTKPMRSFRDVETLANNDYYNQEHELAFYGRGYRSRAIGSTYKAPALVKKEFAWTPTRWSSYSSFYSSADDDDNSDLFVTDPESYLTPSGEEIRQKIHVVKRDSINLIKDLCRLFYLKMLDETKFMNQDMYETNPDAFKLKRELYTKLYNSFMPGYTPLEQAVNYYQTVLDKEADNNQRGASGNHRKEITEFKRENFANPALNHQLALNSLSNSKKMSILNKVSLIGELGSQFLVEKEIGEKVVNNSDIYRKRKMTSYSQIDRINTYQTLFPHYKLKFITQDLIVDVPVQIGEKKQKIIILLDYSGSMNNTPKQIWVNAILIDRFRYVIQGEAEVFFSYFVSRPDDLHFHHIKNAEDVDNFWKMFSNYPSGGGTDISRIVTSIANDVKGGQRLGNLKIDLSKQKPEILIINDGQDSVGTKIFPYRVNAISLMQFSSELKKLCVDTGGKQVRVTEGNEVTAFSSDGAVTLKD